MKTQIIQEIIYEAREEKIMLDFDLAKLYGVETRVFNQAIKRNLQNFPKDFMFRLTAKEWKTMSSQFVMTYPEKRPKTALPYAFTEHGVTMLASVLKSSKARKMNIAIVRAFIALKKFANKNAAVINLVKELKERIDEHDVQLGSIYDAIENLLDEKEEEKTKKITWENRERIGFKK